MNELWHILFAYRELRSENYKIIPSIFINQLLYVRHCIVNKMLSIDIMFLALEKPSLRGFIEVNEDSK